jgi:hypothetical protein
MANYPLLRKGDKLPSVGVLQKLLNRTGATLKVDGDFGGRTEHALKGFQAARQLTPNGVVGATTWTRLCYDDRLLIVDCIDVFDPKIFHQRAERLQEVGANPLLTGGMQLGIQSMISALGAYGGGIFLLRIAGHGMAGKQAISTGAGGWDEWDPIKQKMQWHGFTNPITDFQGIGLSKRCIDELLPIRAQLAPWGSLELHGCKVARGVDGRDFITSLARKLALPVTAGTERQPMGSAFRLVGAVFTAFPLGYDLRSWCNEIPDFTPVSVP